MTTSLTGTVYAPNGTLPLYGVNVYIPNEDPGPITTGLGTACDQCANTPPGDPVTLVQTDEHGNFTLPDVPVTANLPVVIQIGKWRKILDIPAAIPQCTSTALPKIDTTLPAKATETGGDIMHVDMPKIAISTGNLDALECLIRKIGVADSEITTPSGSGHVNLFADSGATESVPGFGNVSGEGADQFKSGFAGGTGMFPDSTTLWGTSTAGTDSLKNYDIVMLSCEGDQYPASKSQTAMNAVKSYADMGGRLFLSHWHNIWIEGAIEDGSQKPMTWPAIATFDNSNTQLKDGNNDTIDETNNPKGMSFATWMLDPAVAGSTTRDLVPIVSGTGYETCTAVDETKAERWVYLDGTHSKPDITGVQNFQFTTPNEAAAGSRCGKVVFSDMHVSGDSSSSPGSPGYPNGCSSAPLTPQEAALAFMFFDIESCVGAIQ